MFPTSVWTENITAYFDCAYNVWLRLLQSQCSPKPFPTSTIVCQCSPTTPPRIGPVCVDWGNLYRPLSIKPKFLELFEVSLKEN